jgi:glycosyltransferase involved in cell wall biosynthesis
MNIWFAANIPGNSQGGVARNMLGFSRELTGFGHDVQLVFARESAVFRTYLVFMVYLAFKLFATPRKERPSVIIARSTDGLCCALLVRFLGLPISIVLQNHGWEERVYEISRARRLPGEPSLFTWKSPLIRFPLLRMTLASCHACACGTLDELRWLRHHFPRQAEKLRYTPNGVDCVEIARPREGWPPHYLCIGAAGWRKNTAYTLAVFASIRHLITDAKLVLVGTGSDSIAALLPPGLAPSSVEIIPAVPMQEMVSYYRRCPFLITTSLYEGGHALAVLEAMACGCIVFTRAIPSISEIIHDRHNGVLLACENPGADAAIIASVSSDRGGVERMSANARHSAWRNRWPRQGFRMNRMLLQLTKTNRTGG